MSRRILLVEDDRDLAEITTDMLCAYEYEVTHVTSGNSAYDILTNQSFDLILLDINLPDESGFELCKTIRTMSTVPIIFASARTNEEDRVNGLDLGADDYIAKPYSLKELLSRINALIRRTYGFSKEMILQAGDLVINDKLRTVTRNQKELSLSLKEFDLLRYLMKHKNCVIKKETLLSEVWGAFTEVEQATVAVHIRWLREKLEKDPKHPTMIVTVWGIGYKFVDKESEV